MVYVYIGIVIALLVLAFFIGAYVVYYIAFARDDKRLAKDEEMPENDYYTPYLELAVGNIRKFKEKKCDEVTVMSQDGLKLFGRYYHYKDGAPVIIFFHGYRSSALRDGSGIYTLGQGRDVNILLVTQRAHSESEGKAITFGIKESKDCLAWVDYVINRFGKGVKIVLWGVSMGAATVLTASNLDFPENVKGIAGDCGFSSPRDIIRKVIKGMHLPVGPAYALAKVGAKLYGGFDLEETSAMEALKNAKVPVLFIHGKEDDFVPCEMSHINYDACTSKKEFVEIENAGHAMSYYVDMEQVEKYAFAFLDSVLGTKSREKEVAI